MRLPTSLLLPLSPLLLLITTEAVLAAANDNVEKGECYYPMGSVADNYDYVPCGGENTTFSQCCITGNEQDSCLPNGMCAYTGKYDYRAACDNEDWENCPNPCPDGE